MKKQIISVILAAAAVMTLTGCSDNSVGGTGTTASAAKPVTTVTEKTAEQTAEKTETAAAGETAETAPAETEGTGTAMSDDELIAKLQEIGSFINGKVSKATTNRAYDENSIMVAANIDKTPAILVRVKTAADIPGAAFEMTEIYREAMAAVGFTAGTLSVNSYETEGSNIIEESMVAWRSADGLTGDFVDGVHSERVEGCSVKGLYWYFDEKATLFTAEEAADLIKKRIGVKAEGLLFEDESSVLVSTAGGSLAVGVRTYEEFLIPAAAEYAYEVAAPIAERSELPFGRINSQVYENDENGGIKQETMIGWTTLDGVNGTYNSHPEGITDGELTLDELYEKYGEYTELIEQAKNNQRVQRDN